MPVSSASDSVVIDDVDRSILHALQLRARAPFAVIAEILGVSEQTVARRYRRMTDNGLIRVLGLATHSAADTDRWLLRITCRPDSALTLAQTLGRRPDVSWVSISAGGAEIVCSAFTRRDDADDELLLRRLPRTDAVRAIDAHLVLHHFAPEIEWSGFPGRLTAEQAARLTRRADTATAASARSVEATAASGDDVDLFAALARDARASHRDLAAATGWSPQRVAQRLRVLEDSGALYYDVDIDLGRFGFRTMSYIWVTVPPADLDRMGNALVRHDEVAFCAAISGDASLIIAVVCRDSADLYRYISHRLTTLPGIVRIETSPVLRRIKQAGTLLTEAGISRPLPIDVVRARRRPPR